VGEFRVPHGIPVLLDAVTAHRDPDSLPVRIAAFESLAVLAGQLESQVFSRDPRAVALLLDATHMTDATTTDRATIRAAATATFALGIVGGPVALHRLRELLTDARADLRDNAATGLARHGVADGIPVLVAMLDAAADAHVASATDQFAQEAQWRRIRTAARAARQLARANTDADLRPVLAALHRVAGDASTPADVQQEVAAAQRELQSALPTR
jgi:hypothetical protein